MTKSSDQAANRADQRAELRFPCVGTAVLYCAIDSDSMSGAEPDLRPAPLRDMSVRGLAFDAATPLEPGQNLLVLIQQAEGGGQERLMAEVCWCRQGGDGLYRVGVRIHFSEVLDPHDPAYTPADDGSAGGIVGVLTSYRQVMAAE